MSISEQKNLERLTMQYTDRVPWIAEDVLNCMINLSYVDPIYLPHSLSHTTVYSAIPELERECIYNASRCGLIQIFHDLRKHADAIDRVCISWTQIGWILFGTSHCYAAKREN